METAQSSGDTPAKKAVLVPAGSPIKTGYISSGDTYPLVISPTAGGVDLAAWAAENRPFILDALAAHGALLFRALRQADGGQDHALGVGQIIMRSGA